MRLCGHDCQWGRRWGRVALDAQPTLAPLRAWQPRGGETRGSIGNGHLWAADKCQEVGRKQRARKARPCLMNIHGGRQKGLYQKRHRMGSLASHHTCALM